jgi:AcrR family transcriptional regulator
MPAARPTAPTEGPRWRRRKDQRPQEILDAALPMFAELGFARTTLDAVAEAAGVTKGTVLSYFGTKMGLLEAALDATAGTNFQRLAAATDGAGSRPPRDVIRDIVTTIADAMDSPRSRALFRLMALELANLPELFESHRRRNADRGRRIVSQALREMVEAGSLSGSIDCDHVAGVIIAPYILDAVTQGTLFHALDRDTLIATHIRVLCDGMATETNTGN